MQAWALQQVLKRMGHEPVTIDRRLPPKSLTYRIARLGYRALKKSVGRLQAPIDVDRRLLTVKQHTLAFIDQQITMSEPLSSTAKLKAHFARQKYDAVIVGSDQAWRPMYSPNIENFFLDFLEGGNIKRIAYASSFGVDEWEFTEEQTERCAVLAKKFDAISVREDSGVELCRKYLGVDASQMPDPTLLLGKANYMQLIGTDRLTNNYQGIFTYFLDKTLDKEALAQQFSERLNEPVYSCQAKHTLSDDVNGAVEDYTMPDVRDWLAGFANARFVLTDSYHGGVFSILFNKPFFILKNTERGQARIESLLKLFEYDGLFTDEKSVFDKIEMMQKYNFKDFSSNLANLSEDGECFLENIFGITS